MPKITSIVGGAIALILALVAGSFVLKACSETTTIPKALQDSLDAYKAAIPAVTAERDSALAKAKADGARAADAERDAKAARSRATVLAGQAARAGRLADSAAAVGEWKTAYEERTAERDTLRMEIVHLTSALTQLDTALAAERAKSVTLAQAEMRAVARRDTLERLNADLRTAAETAGQCRFARVFRCPSRTAVGLVALGTGAVAGAVVASAVTRR